MIIICPPVELQLLLLLSLNANFAIIAAYKPSDYLKITISSASVAIDRSLAFYFLTALESRMGWGLALIAFLDGILGVAHIGGLAVLYVAVLLVKGSVLFGFRSKSHHVIKFIS